jgi:hypothetical protein
MRRLTCSAVLVAAVTFSACGGGGRSQKTSYVDALPPPEEPLVMTTGEVGTYGGRFVVATSVGPQTFNPVTVSTAYAQDITSKCSHA